MEMLMFFIGNQYDNIELCDIIDFDSDDALSGSDGDLILYWSVSETSILQDVVKAAQCEGYFGRFNS